MSLAAVCAVSLQSCVKDGKTKEAEEYVKVGDQVPSFSVKVPGGSTESFAKSDFLGKSSLIVLFTAECPHCRVLMPIVDAAWQEVKDDGGYRIIPIARESLQGAVDAAWSENDMTMPYYLDSDRSAYRKFASIYVPRIYRVDAAGVIRWMQTGEEGITKEVLLNRLGYIDGL